MPNRFPQLTRITLASILSATLLRAAVAPPTTRPAVELPDREYLLIDDALPRPARPGDVLWCVLYDLSGPGTATVVRVRPDSAGKITLPKIPPVPAVDHNPTELARAIANAYRDAKLVEHLTSDVAILGTQADPGPSPVHRLSPEQADHVNKLRRATDEESLRLQAAADRRLATLSVQRDPHDPAAFDQAAAQVNTQTAAAVQALRNDAERSVREIVRQAPEVPRRELLERTDPQHESKPTRNP